MERMSAEQFRKNVDADKSEKDVQADIIEYLRGIGWRVPAELLDNATHKRGVYMVCGTVRRRGDYQGTMQTEGVPDLWLSPPGWKTWLGVELKRPVGFKVSPEQMMMADAGITHIVCSVSELQTFLSTVCSRTASPKPGKHVDG